METADPWKTSCGLAAPEVRVRISESEKHRQRKATKKREGTHHQQSRNSQPPAAARES